MLPTEFITLALYKKLYICETGGLLSEGFRCMVAKLTLCTQLIRLTYVYHFPTDVAPRSLQKTKQTRTSHTPQNAQAFIFCLINAI